MRIGAAILALGGILTGAFFLFHGGSPSASPSHPPPATSPAPSPRTAFAFPPTATNWVATRKRNYEAVRQAAAQVRATMSAFYDAAFMDPKSRQHGLAPEAWNGFASELRERAKADTDSLTLGQAGSTIDTLSVSAASLAVRVLLDPSGRPEAAIANVTFEASGTIAGGGPVKVSNQASFLLRPASGGTWLVVGYPRVKTDVQTPPPGVSPSATPSSSPSGASP